MSALPRPMSSSSPTSDHAHQHQGAFSAAIRVVSGLTLLSRFAGLARDIITARIFGDTALGSAFRAAYAVPNLFRRLFGEGALSAAFLPEYTILRRDQPDAADQLASLVLRLLTLVTGSLTLLLELALGAFLLLGHPAADLALSVRLMMLMLPMMPMVCVTAILGGMLQAHGRFAAPAAAPILLNLFQIGAGLLFFLGVLQDHVLGAYLVGGAAVVASIAQIVWSLAALKGLIRWTRVFDAARTGALSVRERFLPALIGLGTLQLNTFLDMVIAMWPNWFGPTMFGRPTPLDEKSNAILSYTQTIYQFPLGVFGIAVATAIFPLLARTADKPDEFASTLRRGLRLSLYIALPASLGLILARNDLVCVVFSGRRGGFSAEGLARAGDVLAAFSAAVWAYSLNHTLTRAFYARGDTRTPMRVAMGMVALNFSLNMTFIWFFKEAGLAWATATTATVQTLLLLVLLRRKHGVGSLDVPTTRALLRIVLAVLLMGACTVGVDRWMPEATLWRHHLLRLLALVATGAGSYAIASLALRMPELSWLLHPAPRGADGKIVGLSLE